MRRRALLLAVALGTTSALAQGSTPYVYMPFKNFADAAHPFGYYVDSRSAMPANVDVNQVKNAADNAWAQWSAISCAIPKASSLGFNAGTVPNPADGYDTFNVNPVFVTTTGTDYDNIFSYDLSAVTLPLQYAGVLQQCDIYLNGVTRSWSTGTPVPDQALDVETVMLHEEGHCLGIDHQPAYPESVMVGDVLPGASARTLSATDDDILCQRYPISGHVGSPCANDADCGVAGLGCVTQSISGQPTASFCTVACDTGSNPMCDVPLTCQASNKFTGHNGACLRPGTSESQVGKACTMASDCVSPIAICQDPSMGSSGTTYWQDGYCTQSCAQGSPDCPSGSNCTEVDTVNGAAFVCLEACRLGHADCRPGYACALPVGVTGGVCIPRCQNDQDCASGSACRTCDGLCVEIHSNAELGAQCQQDNDCGFGQQCVALDPSQSDLKLCTTPCGSGCSTCPQNSSCHPIAGAGGSLFCLRDCNGAGTCPAGLQCAQLPTGQACTPQCMNDTQCPVGTACMAGVCSNPHAADGGNCLLCSSSDSGITLHPHPSDAGTGGGGGSCGCQSSAEPGLLLCLLFYWSTSWRRRRT